MSLSLTPFDPNEKACLFLKSQEIRSSLHSCISWKLGLFYHFCLCQWEAEPLPLSSLHSHKPKASFPCCPLAPPQGPVKQGNVHACLCQLTDYLPCYTAIEMRQAPALPHQIKPRPRQIIQLALRVRAGHELFTKETALDLLRSTKMKENLHQNVSLLKTDNGETVGSCCFRCTGKNSICFMIQRWKRHHSHHQWVSETSQSKGAHRKMLCKHTLQLYLARSVITSLHLCSRQDYASQITDSLEEILPNTWTMWALFCNSPERSFSSLSSMQIMKATLFFSIKQSNPAHQPINNRTEKQTKSHFQRELSGNSKTEKPSGTGNLLLQRGCCTALLTLH